MSFVAIIGSGALGGAVAHTLAVRDRIGEIRLIDAEERIAQGKALDIRQSSPIDRFATAVVGSGAIAAAAGAGVIVLADPASGAGEFAGEAGLTLLRQVAAVESKAPIVCAGGSQRELIARGVRELHIAEARLIGSAPAALESALRALAGLAIDSSGVPVAISVAGVPPDHAVVAWEEASFDGQPLTSHVPPHVIAGLNARLRGLWPPGTHTLGAAAARVVEAIALGSRRRFSCFVHLGNGRVGAMPVELGEDGVRRVIEPVLTRQERTRLENAVENADF
jgi:malate dehydrogenase